jgi:hypothetical protein
MEWGGQQEKGGGSDARNEWSRMELLTRRLTTRTLTVARPWPDTMVPNSTVIRITRFQGPYPVFLIPVRQGWSQGIFIFNKFVGHARATL